MVPKSFSEGVGSDTEVNVFLLIIGARHYGLVYNAFFLAFSLDWAFGGLTAVAGSGSVAKLAAMLVMKSVTKNIPELRTFLHA